MKAQIRQSTIAICGLAVLVLTGCVKPPKYQAPAPPAAPAWNISQEKLSSHINAGAIDEQWWASFHDPVLTSLVERLAKQNIEIKVAAEHIAQARNARKIARSAGLPSMNAGVGYSHARLSPNGFLSLVEPTPGSSTEYNLFSDNLSASWDLDLNGRIRHQVEAANASIQLSIDDIHALEVAEVSELAQDYVQLRGLQAAHALLLEEVDLLSQEESLILQQYQEGVANLSDIPGVKADREALQSTIPGIESAAHARIEAISYLLALSPGELDKELQTSAPQPPVPSIVSVGLPGDLVRRRARRLPGHRKTDAACVAGRRPRPPRKAGLCQWRVAGRQCLRGHPGQPQTRHTIHRHRSVAAYGSPLQEAEEVEGRTCFSSGGVYVYNPSVTARKFA
jgi:outer membrane protein TolC